MESYEIAESKAALCCGFAIALRALFLGILSYSPSLAEGVRGWVVMLSVSEISCHCERPLGRAAINEQGIPRRLIATLTLAMTQNSTHKNVHRHVERSETSHHHSKQHANMPTNNHRIPNTHHHKATISHNFKTP